MHHQRPGPAAPEALAELVAGDQIEGGRVPAWLNSAGLPTSASRPIDAASA